MWGHNSNTNCGHICHPPTMPCLCTCCHANWYQHTCNLMTQWHNSHQLPFPQNPLNNPFNNPTFHDQEAMVPNEIDTWLMLNPDNGQNLNYINPYQCEYNPQGMQHVHHHHGNYGEQQQQQQEQHQMYDFSRAPLDNTPTSFLNASLPAIVPEATPGSYSSNTVDWSRVYEYSSLPFHHGNLIEEAVGSSSNLSSSEGKQQQKQQPDASNKTSIFPPTSRQDRVLRYFEKKKTRKYEKKVMRYSSRKAYAQIRPRIRGRFAKRTQVDAHGDVADKS